MVLIIGVGIGIAGTVCAFAQDLAQPRAEIHFRLQEREVVEGRLKSFSTRNGEREARIRKWFADSGWPWMAIGATSVPG